MTSSPIVSIIFRLINFAIVAGAALYVFIYYGISFIKNKIEERRTALEVLQAKNQNVEHDKDLLIDSIRNQKITYQELMQKLHRWNEKFVHVLIMREQEKERLKNILQKRIDQQSQSINSMYMQKQIMPHAVELARVSLIEQYESKEKGNQFNARIIKHLQKSLL
jgi:hypothetical protein